MGDTDLSVTRNLVLSLCDITQEGSVPPACAGTQMVTAGMRIYLFGGADERQSYDTLYRLEIERSTWSVVETSGFSKPTPRYGHTFTFFRDNFLLFGGLERSDAEDRDLRTQQVQSNLSPPPFTDSSLYPSFGISSINQRLWAHRGIPSNSLYLLKATDMTWTTPKTTSLAGSFQREIQPPPLCFHAATSFSTSNDLIENNLLLIWGGSLDPNFKTLSNDLYMFDLNNQHWIPCQQTGAIPSPRYGHQMVDLQRGKGILLFGGFTNESKGDTSNGSTIFFLDCSSIPNNASVEQASFKADHPHTVVWSVFDTLGTPPGSRAFHSMDFVNNRLFIFAGLSKSMGSCGMYILDVQRRRWCRPLYEGDIGLAAPGTAVLHDKLLVFGGARHLGNSIALGNGRRSFFENQPARASSTTPRLSRRLFFLSVLEIKRSMNAGDYKFKLVTVGDSGVGKSCLLERFSQDVFDESHAATVGVDFRSVVTMVRGRLVTVQLWDTAGQERFCGVTGNYYRNANGFVIVFDATQRSSFEHCLNWLAQIKEHHDFGPDTVKLLIGNKQDLVDEIQVSEEDAKRLADQIGAIYLGTSARTGAGVDSAFLLAAGQLVEIMQQGNKQRKVNLGEGVSLENNGMSRSSFGQDTSQGGIADIVCGSCIRGGN